MWSQYKEVAALSNMGEGGQGAVVLPEQQLWEGPPRTGVGGGQLRGSASRRLTNVFHPTG